MEKLKFTLYLAGPWRDLEYRKVVKEKYGDNFILLDPMVLTFEEVYNDLGKELHDIYLIRRDKKMIDQCDIVIAKVEYLPPGQIIIGTIMEIMYAHTRGIPVFLVSSSEELLKNPWLHFHSRKGFYTIEECCNYILTKK